MSETAPNPTPDGLSPITKAGIGFLACVIGAILVWHLGAKGASCALWFVAGTFAQEWHDRMRRKYVPEYRD